MVKTETRTIVRLDDGGIEWDEPIDGHTGVWACEDSLRKMSIGDKVRLTYDDTMPYPYRIEIQHENGPWWTLTR